MSPEKTKALFEKYPKLYAGREDPITKNLMGFGFECGDGWYDIIDKLSSKLEPMDVRAVQVKEKYGTLRFYTDGHNDEAEEFITEAENQSGQTCERCGAPGDTKGGSWFQTLCRECHERT